ncbi:hypothetical protein EDB80DRAFT_693501 [Ilyonectria destructans]|nr:hypothetical protein EDB80DRAFT_693501 [Ilyonectria destructans]
MAEPTSIEGADVAVDDSTGNDLYGLVPPAVKYGIEGAKLALYARKEWNEGSAAKERQRLDHSIREHVGPIANDVSRLLDSGARANETYARCAEEITDTIATTSKVADSIGRNVENITKSAVQASEDISSSAQAWKETAETTKGCVNNLNKNIGGVCIIAGSMFGSIVHALEEAVKEIRMINHNLQGIKDELRAQNTLVSSGGSGPDGFARVVYGFMQLHMKKHSGDGHQFFNDLDSLCACMKVARRSLAVDSQVVFHLLIPAWYEIYVKVPLHFPDELQPLRIVGPKHGGKPLVSFNLPRAQNYSLDGISNVLDPEGCNTKAEIATGVTFLVGGGLGTNGACLAAGLGIGAMTGLGALIAMPFWLGSFITVGAPVAATAAGALDEMLREEPPRILGSDIQLEVDARSVWNRVNLSGSRGFVL